MNGPAISTIAAGVLAAATLALWRWMCHVEPRHVEITRHDVVDPHLPEELDGFTLCQISDVHITATGRNECEIAAAIRTVHADLYVFTGDQIHRESGIDAFLHWFDDLGDAVRPCVAVQGNAEHKPHFDASPLLHGLAARGVPDLNNATYCFPWNHGAVQIVGVDDPHTDHDDFDRAYADSDPNAWTLLLSHSPEGVLRLNHHRADLILSGHTHGGQIRMPLVGAIIHGTKHIRGLVMGWYEGEELRKKAGHDIGQARLYVSRGLGTSRFAGRLLCRPELALFTLRKP